MFVLVLAAEADETRQAITFLIMCLVGVAALLSALTIWYWRYTSPKRHLGIPPPRVAGTKQEVGVPAMPSDIPVEAPAVRSVDVPADAESAIAGDPVRVGVVAATTTVRVGGPLAAPSTAASSSPVPASGRSPDESRIEVPDRSIGREATADRIEVADRCTSGSSADRNGRRRADGASSVSSAASTSSDSAVSSVAPSEIVDPVSAPATGTPSRRNSGSRPPVAAEANGRHHTPGGSDDELTEARRRRDRKKEVLSDEDWAAIMKYAFERMYQ